MKNIKQEQLMQCLRLSNQEFEDVIEKIYGEGRTVEFIGDGSMEINGFTDDDDFYFTFIEKLEEYFDIKISDWDIDRGYRFCAYFT